MPIVWSMTTHVGPIRHGNSRLHAAVLGAAAVLLAACDGSADARSVSRRADFWSDTAPTPSAATLAYAGYDASGVPNYVRRTFTSEERALLRTWLGVDDPSLLYLDDSTSGRYLKYDVRPDPGRATYVNSYGVGFESVRRADETWREFDARIRNTPPGAFGAAARTPDKSLESLDPAVREIFRQMITDAARAGFDLGIVETYRPPDREAFLLAQGRGRTYTATSLHSYGRAVDFTLDGKIGPTRGTRPHWVAFRHWVSTYRGGIFRILGTPDTTWDWAHVEIQGHGLGFPDVETAIAAARACASGRAASVGLTPRCTFPVRARPIPPADSSAR